MEAFKAYWAAREPRERLMLGGGAAVAIVLVLYLLIWDPIQSSRAKLATDLPKLRAQAAQFRVDVTEAESLRGRIKSGDSARALPAIIEASAKEAGLRESIKQIQPLSNERSQLNLSNVAFDALVPWLARLAEAEGVSVETISASGASAAGRVQVESLVLRTARAR